MAMNLKEDDTDCATDISGSQNWSDHSTALSLLKQSIGNCAECAKFQHAAFWMA
jgi:hypothetical protein